MKKSTKIIITILIVLCVLITGFLLVWQFDVFGIFKDYKAVPAISLKGDAVMTIEGGTPYSEPGFTAMIGDEDATKSVKVDYSSLNITKVGKYEISYTLSNLKGKNTVTKKRTVTIVDTTAPTITIKGDKTVKLLVGAEYKDAGATAADKVDGDISAKIVVDNKVNTTNKGKYTVTYTATDSSGNTATAVRTVVVTKISSGKTVYLTFDDGPSHNTDKILDLLKQYNAHATFFVIGTDIESYKPQIKRIVDEGHTIAIHTNSHEYNLIYKSTDAFWADNAKIRNKVKAITGITSDIMRFPGGSSNTISANYCKGVMSQLVKQVPAHGYEHFDWNISSGDAERDGVPAKTLYNNVMAGIHYNYETPIVLMHDTNAKDTSVVALKSILQSATAEGYTFEALDDTVSPVHHGVNN